MVKKDKRKFKDFFRAYYNDKYLFRVKDAPDWNFTKNSFIPLGVQGADVTSFTNGMK